MFFLLIVSIWAFNEEKYITYPIKIIFILILGLRWMLKAHLKINFYQAWCLVMIVFSGVATLIAPDLPVASHTFINVLQVFLIAFVGVSYLDDNEKIDFLMLCIIIGGCLLGIRLLATTPLSVWFSFERLGEAIGYNANDVGNKAAISAIIAIASLKEKKGKKQILLLVVFIMMTLLVLFSGSRKSLIAVAFAVLLFYTIGLEKKRNIIFALIGITIVFSVLYYLMMNNSVLYATIGRRIESMIGVVRFGQSEASSIDLRERYMQMAWNYFKQSPFSGIGLGNFAVKSGLGIYCHCDYLEVLCSYGLFGAFVYYLPIFKGVITSIGKKRKNQMDYTVLIIMLVLLLNFFTMVMYISAYTQILVMICLAYQKIDISVKNMENKKYGR